jgi:hypothetical protein
MPIFGTTVAMPTPLPFWVTIVSFRGVAPWGQNISGQHKKLWSSVYLWVQLSVVRERFCRQVSCGDGPLCFQMLSGMGCADNTG